MPAIAGTIFVSNVIHYQSRPIINIGLDEVKVEFCGLLKCAIFQSSN
jgi:hypothetical protein